MRRNETSGQTHPLCRQHPGPSGHWRRFNTYSQYKPAPQASPTDDFTVLSGGHFYLKGKKSWYQGGILQVEKRFAKIIVNCLLSGNSGLPKDHVFLVTGARVSGPVCTIRWKVLESTSTCDMDWHGQNI